MVQNFSDQELNTLFRKHLTTSVLPTEVHARIQRQVLCEVFFTLQAHQVNRAVVKSRTWHQALPPFLHAPQLAVTSVGVMIVVLAMLYLYQHLWSVPSTARIAMSESGTAFIVSNRQRQIDSILPAEPSPLSEGDNIFVHSGRVQIMYNEEWRTTLSAGSSVELQKYQQSEDSNQVILLVRSGEALTEVLAPLRDSDSIEVRSPSAVASARGTSFIVRSDSDTSTYFAVLSGTIEVDLAGEKITVSSGEELQATSGTTPQVHKQKRATQELLAFEDAGATTRTTPVPEPQSVGSERNDTAAAAVNPDGSINALGVTANGDWYLVCCSTDMQLSWVAADAVSKSGRDSLPVLPDEVALAFREHQIDAAGERGAQSTQLLPDENAARTATAEAVARKESVADTPSPTPSATPSPTPSPTPSATSTVGSIVAPIPTGRPTSTPRATPTLSPLPPATLPAATSTATMSTASRSTATVPSTGTTSDSPVATLLPVTPVPSTATSTPTPTDDSEENGGSDQDDNADEERDDPSPTPSSTSTSTAASTSPASAKPTATPSPVDTEGPGTILTETPVGSIHTATPIHLITIMPSPQPTENSAPATATPIPPGPTLVVPHTPTATATQTLETGTPHRTETVVIVTASAEAPQLVTPTFTPVVRPTENGKLTPLPEPTNGLETATPPPSAQPTIVEPTPTATVPVLVTPTPTADREPGFLKRLRNGQHR